MNRKATINKRMSCSTPDLPCDANNLYWLQISGVLAQEWGFPSDAVSWDGLQLIRV